MPKLSSRPVITNPTDNAIQHVVDGGTSYQITKTNYFKYFTHPIFTLDTQLIDKKYADDLVTAAGIITKDLTSQLGAGGVTIFTIDTVPAAPSIASIFYNGTRQIYGVNFTISGTTITWIETSPSFVLGSNDGTNHLWIEYEKIVTPIIAPTAFNARLAPLSPEPNITGNAEVHTVKFDDDSSTGYYDLQNGYSTVTGQYTAAFAQIFNAGTGLRFGGFTAAHSVEIGILQKDSGGTPIRVHSIFSGKPYTIRDQYDQLIVDGSDDYRLSIGDTLEITITGSGGATTIGVLDIASQFYGHIVTAL